MPSLKCGFSTGESRVASELGTRVQTLLPDRKHSVTSCLMFLHHAFPTMMDK